MTRHTFVYLTVGILTALPSVGEKKADDFVVIVHPSNQFDTLSRSQLNYLFLRKVSRWPWGAEASPIDLPAHDSVRREFTREVLRTSETQLEIYWIDQRATHGITPPAIVRDAAAAKALVAARPGAIAYIPATVADHTVKVIRVEP